MAFEFIRVIVEPGPVVLCDICSADHTIVSKAGGLLFGTKGVCPDCAPDLEASAKRYGEERYITKRANPGESFRDFVYRVRVEADS